MRLDLGAGQDDAGLEGLVDREVVAGSAVEGDGRLVAHGMAPSDVGRRESAGGAAARAHERRPDAGRRSSASPPTGCPTRRPSPARWCSYGTVDHCTSPPFVPGNRTRCDAASARAAVPATPGVRPRTAQAPQRSGRRPSPRTSSALSRTGSRARPGGSAAASTDDVRRQPDLVDPALVRRQPAGDRQPERRRLSPVELAATAGRCPCRTTAGRRASPASVSCSAPATISLAEALPAVDEARRPGSPGRSRRRRPAAVGRDLVARRRPAPRRRPEAMNWLAILRAAVTKPPGLPRRSRIELRPAGRDVRGSSVVANSSAAASREAGSRM